MLTSERRTSKPAHISPIKALRDAYRALGNDPTRYRGSNEALVRRISQGKELYRVNTIVDVNNLISLETLHSAGTFDLDRVQPPIIFRVGQPCEFYFGIGKGQIKIEELSVFADHRLGRSAARPVIRKERWFNWKRPGL